MTKPVTVRDAMLANGFAIVLLAIVATLWGASAALKDNASSSYTSPSRSVAETLYAAGRHELLRDSAVSCEKNFDLLAANAFRGQAKADWTAAVLALCAIGMLF